MEMDRVKIQHGLSPTLKAIARKVLPDEVRRSIRWVMNETHKGKVALRPGGKSQVARYLDQRAARRVRQAMIAKTDDMLTVRWLGEPIRQYPLDAWVIQEVIGELKPDIIVEGGTYFGGSAYFLACLCDLLNHGEVISIDIAARRTLPHPRVTYLHGSTIDPKIVGLVAKRMQQAKAERILVVLDDNHYAEHVRQELEIYSPLVPVGSYIHVQDGNWDELPCFRGLGAGPMVAAKSFLKENSKFIRDLEVEFRYVMTDHPYGWLKRIALD
jgi:cephalosporin hydroxylase